MITFKELMGDHVISEIPIAAQQNLSDLQTKVNLFLSHYTGKTRVTSGFRTLVEHFRIYSTIAFKKGVPFNRHAVPTKSNHLYGKAVDLLDTDGSLYTFAFDNQPLLESIGLWCERGTKGWLHCQTVPPLSGSRFFYP